MRVLIEAALASFNDAFHSENEEDKEEIEFDPAAEYEITDGENEAPETTE